MCPAAERTVDKHHRAAEKFGDSLEEPVGEETDCDGPWQTEQRDDDGDSPVFAVDAGDLECAAADEHDHDLAADHDGADGEVEVVPVHALEDVEFVVEASVVEH